MSNQVHPEERVVITGIGLTAPNGNNLKEFRENLLAGKSGVQKFETRYLGEVLAGICDFNVLKYQKKKRITPRYPRWIGFDLLLSGSV